ncbi:hypothetical protein KRMM14A1004_39440 [Krasilnikovia sp. MM14-A1004]
MRGRDPDTLTTSWATNGSSSICFCIKCAGDRVGERRRGRLGRGGQWCGLAEAGEVDSDHVEASGQRTDHRIPDTA